MSVLLYAPRRRKESSSHSFHITLRCIVTHSLPACSAPLWRDNWVDKEKCITWKAAPHAYLTKTLLVNHLHWNARQVLLMSTEILYHWWTYSTKLFLGMTSGSAAITVILNELFCNNITSKIQGSPTAHNKKTTIIKSMFTIMDYRAGFCFFYHRSQL